MKAILFLFALPCFAGYFVGNSGASVSSGASTSCVFASNVVAGDILVASSTWESSTMTPSVTDTLSSSFAQAVINTSGSVKGAVYVAIAGGSGADTITFSVSGATFQNTRCGEFSSALVTSTVDTANSGTFSGTPASVSVNVTTTVNGDLIIGSAGGFKSAGYFYLSDTTYNFVAATNGQDSGAMESLGSGTSGTYTVPFGNVTNDVGLMLAVALKPPSGITIISPASIPQGAKSVAYAYTFSAAGGAGAYTWSVSAGSLPSGITLSGATISGTPTVAGPFSFTIQATDGSTTQTKAISLGIGNSLTSITVPHVGSNSSNSVTIAGTTSGNTLLVTCAGTGNFYGGVPTDTLSTSYSFVSSPEVTGNNYTGYMSYVGVLSSGGSDTITCPAYLTTDFGIAVAEVAGIGTIYDIRSLTSGASNSGTITSSTLTPTVPNEILYAFGTRVRNTGSITVASPLTLVGAIADGAAGYLVVSSTSGTTVSFTVTSNTGAWGIGVASFRAVPPSIPPLPSSTQIGAFIVGP